jgi:hypothetical protein
MSPSPAHLAESPLTPPMEALLQAADCFVSPEPIPHLLLLAPLQPSVRPAAQTALAALLQQGWLSAPVPATALLTAQSRAFLATRRSDAAIQTMVVQALCISVTQLIEAHDAATLALVAPHLLALADTWQERGDRYALTLSLAASTYLTTSGQVEQARPYLARATALDQALGLGLTRPRRRWWGWW